MKKDVVINQKVDFSISNNLKKYAGMAAIIGLAVFVVGLLIGNQDFRSMRLWSSLLYNDLYFTWIALSAVFFITAFRLGYSGWQVLIQRVPEAMGFFMLIGLPLILIIFFLGKHSLYEWTHENIVAHDGFLTSKKWWLNKNMFIGFTLLWIFSLSLSFLRFRNNSIKLDSNGEYSTFAKSFVLAAIFLFFFAVGNSVSTWHWVMSVEPHWYSTLYAWYLFASALVAAIGVMIITLVLLKRSGYLPYVNLNHFHDLGKLLFAFSIFWTYLWFSQHMLIWYANIPEETVHFKHLWKNHGFLFWGSVVLNFIIPLITLMSRDAKRNLNTLVFASIVILIGHWVDYFLMIRPGTEKLLSHEIHQNVVTQIGFVEIGLGLLFAGVFAYVIAWALSKASIVPLNNPFEQESIEHHI